MHRNNRGPVPLWQLALYIAVLGIVSLFLAPVTALWWIIPLLGAAVPVVLAIIQGREQRETAGEHASAASPATDTRELAGVAEPEPMEHLALEGDTPADAGASTGAGRLVALDSGLSDRELEVLALLAAGKSNAETAEALFISVGTVKSHSANIYRKLAAKNRTEAVARARELGVLE